MIKVSKLEGWRSLRVLNGYTMLLVGLKMLPDYKAFSFEDFYALLDKLDEIERRKVLTEAVMCVKLDEEEVAAMVSFCSDSNGVPYGPENMKRCGPDQLLKMIVEVCLEVAKFKIDFVSEAEKKK